MPQIWVPGTEYHQKVSSAEKQLRKVEVGWWVVGVESEQRTPIQV